ncbi:hypothetical protein O181_031904 [Austropuccinia psidii MF-1]|uniref:Uncharacterized protein n=1 Tax=Austropuccinia psidii MF-1 TaxID=1389203 RepID=A0A9Q3H715_9BASI|nr:hypothetical protein [Austropuccinia psidii MF-1]
MQGKPTLTTCKRKITIINPVVTSKCKFPKAVEDKFVQGTVKGTLESQGTSQRTENICPESEDQEEDTLDTVVDGKALREIIPTLPLTFQFNRNLKPEDYLGASFQKICLREISFKDFMEITKGWNLTRKFRLLEERETRIKENQATIQAIEDQLNQTWPTIIPSGSQGVDQPNSLVDSHHSSTTRSVAKSKNYSQS